MVFKQILFRLRQLREALKNSLNINLIIKKHLCVHKYHEYAYESSSIIENVEEKGLIVSLTTYNKRIYEVYLVIESIFHQTVKPDKIILWLSKDEFDIEELPIVLKRQQTRGLCIKFCEDLKSYKKLLPTLNEYPDCNIITIDDDFIYPNDFIENMLNTHRKYPDCVCYYRGTRIGLNKNTVLPYKEWKEAEEEYTPSLLNFATGAGGIFYPLGCFSSSVFNTKLIFKLAPYADDIWFKAMTLIVGIKYVKIRISLNFEYKFISLDNMQDIALYRKNVDQNGNDNQIQAVFEYFDLYLKIQKNM